MTNISKETMAILKLSKDTIEGKVTWTTGNKSRIILGGEEEIIDNVYIAQYHGKYVRIYHYRSKHYYDYLEFNWVDNYRLELTDSQNNSLWVFPPDNAIIGLYNTVREKTSNVDDFLNSILEDK